MEEKQTDNLQDTQNDQTLLKENQNEKKQVIEITNASPLFKYFLGIMIAFGICFVICVFVFQVVFLQIEVVGFSMQPTINNSAVGSPDNTKHNDIVFCYRTTNVKAGDIVIIDETRTGTKIIKRVIAVPGQTISFVKTSENISSVQYKILIDGQPIAEEYIKDQSLQLYRTEQREPYLYYNTLITALVTSGTFTQEIIEGQYFVMGDNRNNSTDSRYFGPINQNEIEGKVVLQVKYGQTLFGAILKAIF